jgi:hypothetical protein
VSIGIEVIQGLHVFGVETEGVEVRVDIYGGEDCVCGTLVYRFENRAERLERVRVLESWCVQQTAVTYVRRDGSAALIDELVLLSEALAG